MLQKIKNIYHLFNAFFANIWYGFPSKKLTVIGVTGTDGKTTTTSLIYHILKTAGKNVSMISTVGANINGKTYGVGFHVTTPSSWMIQRFLKQGGYVAEVAHENFVGSPRNKNNYMVLEVTSHALDQDRVWGIDFAVGVLTNVTHEHLDYHKTYENYVKTKASLLKMAKVAVVNRDDKSYKIVKSKIKSQKSKIVTYGMQDSDVTPKKFPFKTKLFGKYNKYNILAAIAVCKTIGISDFDIRKGIETFSLPIGRAEIVYDKGFTVMIDFAHTPNAFAKLLPEIKKQTKGKLIHVFGAAGLRDASKRPLMGNESAKYADVIILTSEDPRSESVDKIMDEIAMGIHDKTLIKIANRQEAITTAIKMAKKGDFVVITGKSHEQSMNYGKGEESWSEHEAVSHALKLKMKN